MENIITHILYYLFGKKKSKQEIIDKLFQPQPIMYGNTKTEREKKKVIKL